MTRTELFILTKMRRPGGAALNRADMQALVSCPDCGSDRGQACQEGGQERPKVHFARMQLAQIALRALLSDNPKQQRTKAEAPTSEAEHGVPPQPGPICYRLDFGVSPAIEAGNVEEAHAALESVRAEIIKLRAWGQAWKLIALGRRQ